MNYGGANNNSTTDSGWENILLNNYFSGDGSSAAAAGPSGGVGGDPTQASLPSTNNDGSGTPGVSTGPPPTTYDSAGYAAYLQANYQMNNGLSGGVSGGSQDSSYPGVPPPPPNTTANTTTAGGGLPYGGNGGYSLTMPSAASAPGGYTPQQSQYGQPATAGGGGHNSRYVSGETTQYNTNTVPQFSVHENNISQHNTPTEQERRSLSSESQTNNNDPYGSVDYGNYYNQTAQGGSGIGGAASGTSASNNYPPTNNNNFGMSAAGDGGGSSSTHNPQNYNPPNAHTAGATMGDIDYCDALLRGMDDPSFGWLAGAFGGSTAAAAAAAAANNSNARNGYNHYSGGANTNNSIHQQQQQQQLGMQGLQQQYNADPMSGANGEGGERMALPGDSMLTQNTKGGASALDAFFVAQHQQQQQQQQAASSQFQTAKKTSRTGTVNSGARRQASSRAKTRSGGRKAATTTTTSSTRLSPNRSDHSSLPSHQIDPLLEQISLTVSAVSLEPLSGNEVVRHIRTKTDDVITRFLPCVDFLVNCQQELRQGLALAQRSRNSRTNGRSRNGGGGMTPRQFLASYVAPLPKRFERHNESIMARDHLRTAKSQLEALVRDAQAAVPQGCDNVKNAFLGGMRENESWGLRKWLSKHGGAGSICNDLEEVMRHVKALKKEDASTKRLAEMLRPIARQAFERLKKDVPQAYQEQSSAHPYLPFFHRLEACLKQMATYDPEEDTVICLDDSDDEEEDVKVVEKVKSEAPVANTAGSSGVKKRGKARVSPAKSPKRSPKRKSDEDIAISKWVASYAEEGNDAKRSRHGSSGEDEGNFASQFFDNTVKEEKKSTSSKNKEPEIICLDSSDDEDENDDAAAAPAATTENGGQEFGQASLSPAPLAAAATAMQEYGQSVQHAHQHNVDNNAAAATAAAFAAAALGNAAAATGAGGEGEGGGAEGQWRCVQCTFLNEEFASKCGMCNDDDSGDGGNASDDLAMFLGGSGFFEGAGGAGNSNHSFPNSDAFSRHNSTFSGIGSESDTGGGTGGGDGGSQQQQQQPPQYRALQSADAQELETLAEHISNGGSLPKQAHQNSDECWATIDTFPQILLLFRTILQHPTSHRFLEPVDENHLFVMGLPAYSSIVKHPLCFHEIVSALSRSEDAVKYTHITMRLSNGQLPAVYNNTADGGLWHWNMWNGLHLIEAIDLVLLNSLAYNTIGNGGGEPNSQQQLRGETESLRNVLWEGVNDMLERLQPQEQSGHLPQRRSVTSSLVVGKDGG